MKTSTFVNELTKSSAVFGRKHDIKVQFQGDQAATNGETIKLPAIDHNSTMSEEQMDVLRGYVDHEAGHVRHTNHDAVKRFAAQCRRNKNMYLKSVWNALEDIWLERKVIEDYPGAAHNLKATSTAVNKEFLKAAAKDPDMPKKDMVVGPVAITWEGRKAYGGDTCTECLDQINPDLRRQIPKWIDALDHCRTTEDVIALAKVVEKSLRDADYKEDEPDDGKAGDDAGDGEGRPDPDADHDHDTEDGSEDAGTDEDGDGGAEDDGAVGNASDGDSHADVEPETDPEPWDCELSDIVTKMFERGEITKEGAYTYVPYDAEDEWHHRTFDTPYSQHFLKNDEPEMYDEMVAEMAGEVNSMRNKLMRGLMSKQKRDWDYGREDGRLDTKRFTQAFNGRANVFKMRTDRTDLDTAVSVLVDLSGSMSGGYEKSKIYLAAQCCIAICECLDKAGIPHEVLGFTNEYKELRSLRRSKVDYDRLLPLHMFIFKQFEERLFEAKGGLASMRNMALWDNSDGDAIANAHMRLRERNEKRRVMLVLSDGMPACAGNRYNINQYTRNAVQDAAKSGTDIIGIGIMSDAVERFYPKSTVINEVADLAGAAMDQLARALMGERYQVDNSKLMDVV